MKKAFTMMELIFVIVVIGILVAVAMPRTGSNKLYEAATQVLSHIRYTQHLAMVDDKFSDTNATWWQERWQIQFESGSAQVGYIVYSDANHGGGANNDEMAIDPLSRKTISRGSGVADLKAKYGITSVGGTCNLTVVFDFLGRPYLNVATGAYDNPVPSPNGCTVVLSSSEGSVSIKIHPETGYACILNTAGTGCI